MKKNIFATLMVFMSFINAHAQNNKIIMPMFSITANQMTSKFTKQNVNWVLKNGKIHTEIKGKGESNYLEVNIPKQNAIIEDTTFYQRVILDIKHKLELTKDAQAMIEVKLYGYNKWTAFVPITKEFIDILGMRQKATEKFINMYPKGIFNIPLQKPQNYDKLYSLHVAGGDAKIALIDVTNIEKFRFKLKNNSIKDMSLWEFDMMTMYYVKKWKSKAYKKSLKESKPTNSGGRLKEENSSDINEIDAEFDNGGTCPKPHGH